MTRKRRLAQFRAMARNVSASTTVGLWVCVLSTIGLLVASFLVPPRGVIDPSVLKGGSLIFAFAGLFELREAIREGLGFKLTHGGTTVEVKDLDGKKTEENNENTDDHEEA